MCRRLGVGSQHCGFTPRSGRRRYSVSLSFSVLNCAVPSLPPGSVGGSVSAPSLAVVSLELCGWPLRLLPSAPNPHRSCRELLIENKEWYYRTCFSSTFGSGGWVRVLGEAFPSIFSAPGTVLHVDREPQAIWVCPIWVCTRWFLPQEQLRKGLRPATVEASWAGPGHRQDRGGPGIKQSGWTEKRQWLLRAQLQTTG